MEKYNYTKWLTAFKENAVKYKKEVDNNKKLFNHTKEQITKKYGEYLKLVKNNKLINITKDLSKEIKAYTFDGDNYPFDLFNICGEDEYYFGWNVIDNVDRKISKNIKNKKKVNYLNYLISYNI